MTVQTEKFNVSVLMRQIIESSAADTPEELADEVITAIPEVHYREALLALLRGAIVRTMAAMRSALPSATDKATQAVVDHANGTKSEPHKNSANSAKVASIRTWASRLSIRIFTNENSWKRLADCTFDDLVAAATLRQQQATAMVQRAEEFEAFAALVKEYEVDSFGALPEDVLEKVLSD